MSPWHFSLLGQPAGFAAPALLWLALAVLVAGGALALAVTLRHSRLSRFITPARAARLAPGQSRLRTATKAALSVAGLTLMCVALARPQLGAIKETVKRRGIDVVVVLDASRSMLARDVAPDRMARAKLELEALLAGLQGDRVGLVTFAGSAFVQMPLTSDYAAARMFLRPVDPSAMPEGGTEIGSGIRLAKQVLDNADHGARERAVVVISDGEDWGGDALPAAEMLKQAGVRLFAVGVGVAEGAPIPVLDGHGAQRGYEKDAAGNPVLTRLDREGLTRIAHAAGGEAFWDPHGVAIGEVVRRIEAMQKSDLADEQVQSYVERFQWFAGLGLLLSLAGMVMPSARRRRRARGSAAVVTAAMAAFVLVGLGTGPTAQAAELLHRPDPAIARGLEAYGRGDYKAALAAFDEAARRGPRATVDYDRGTALYKLGRFDEAKQAFARAAAAETGAPALYNLGNALAGLKDEPGAIAAYRKALMANPKAEAARHNLEVLLQKRDDEKQKQQPQNQKKDQKNEQQKQAGNEPNKDQKIGQKDQQKQNGGGQPQQQQQQAGNEPNKDQKDGQKADQKANSKADQKNGRGQEQPQQQAAANQGNQEQKGEAQQPTPGDQKPAAAARSIDRAAQARADAKLSPDSARVLDTMRATDRTLPLSRFAPPPPPRRMHGNDW